MPTMPPLPIAHQNPTGTKTPFYNTPNIPLPLALATTNKKNKFVFLVPVGFWWVVGNGGMVGMVVVWW